MKDQPELLTLDQLQGLEGTIYQVTPSVSGEAMELKLDEVEDTTAKLVNVKHLPRTPFTLIYEGPKQPLLEDQMCRFKADVGPEFDGYLSSFVTPQPDIQYYQVIFN